MQDWPHAAEGEPQGSLSLHEGNLRKPALDQPSDGTKQQEFSLGIERNAAGTTAVQLDLKCSTRDHSVVLAMLIWSSLCLCCGAPLVLANVCHRQSVPVATYCPVN